MEKNISGRTPILILIFLCTTFARSTAQNADIAILRQVQIYRVQHTQYDGLMKGFTNSVYPVAIAVPIGQLAYEFASGDTAILVDGFKTVAALSVNTIITFGLKYAINRRRPYQTYTDIHPYQYETDPSFRQGIHHTHFHWPPLCRWSIKSGT